jgi:hypothetical protein
MHETTSENWILNGNCLILVQPSIGIFGNSLHAAAGYTAAAESSVTTVKT